jgi:hypothetical protein
MRHWRDLEESWERLGRYMGGNWKRPRRDIGETWEIHGRGMEET